MPFPVLSDQDTWWRHTTPDNPLPAMALGARIRQDALQYGLQVEQLKIQQEQQAILAQEHLYKLQLQTQIMQGSAELAKIGATIKDWSDPSVKNTLFEFANTHPAMAGTPAWKSMENFHEEAVKRKDALIREQTTAPMWELRQADLWDEQANTLAAAEPEKAAQLRANAAVLRSRLLPPKETIETFDAQGNPIVKISRGVAGGTDGLTTATKSQVQQRMIGFEKSVGIAAELYSKLTPEMMGIKGLLGDVVVDKGLAQFAPELANKERINGRTLLRVFNENIIKSLKVDAQVNKDEEKRLLAALPDPGAVSSLPDAQEKIKTFMGLIRDQARIDAKQSGTPVPIWASTLAELQAKFKAGEITEDQAVELMKKYGIR